MKTRDKNIVQVAYNLHNTSTASSMVHIWDRDGNRYAISDQGIAFRLEEEEYYPLAYNPFPWTTIQARVMRRLPKFILWSSGVSASILLVYFTIMFECPPCQEAFLNAVAWWGWATQIAFTLAFSLTFVAIAVWQFSKGIRVEQNQFEFEQQPDASLLCLIASKHEHDRTLDDRLKMALAQMTDEYSPMLAVAVIRFRDPVAYLYTPTGDKDPRMDRSAPKYINLSEYTDKLFVAESWDDYQAYCAQFTTHMKEYLLKQEHKRAGRISDAQTNHLSLLRRAVCTIVAIMILCSGLVAQKSKQVQEYLGERYTMDRPVGKVKFVFQAAILERIGDGKFTYQQLLPNNRYYSDKADAGKLISITVGSQRIYPIRHEATTSTPEDIRPLPIDPVRPRPLPGGKTSSGTNWPDSAEMAQHILQTKNYTEKALNQVAVLGRPIWEAMMYFFFKSLGVLIGLLGFLRYIAKTAANESAMSLKGIPVIGGWILNAQQGAAGLSLICCWIIAGFTLIDIFLFLLSFDFPLWILVIIWFPVLWIAERITDWLVPNPKILKKGDYRQ